MAFWCEAELAPLSEKLDIKIDASLLAAPMRLRAACKDLVPASDEQTAENILPNRDFVLPVLHRRQNM